MAKDWADCLCLGRSACLWRRVPAFVAGFVIWLALIDAVFADSVRGMPERGSMRVASTPLRILGLPHSTEHHSPNSARAALGKALFFDTRLSADGRIACASCHKPDHALSDVSAVSAGHADRRGVRNAPSLLNVAYQSALFWEGRQTNLEALILEPLLSPIEHGLSDEDALLSRVKGIPEYMGRFNELDGASSGELRPAHITKTIAAYLRTLVSGNSPFDRYQFGGDRTALSDDAARGLEIFRGRGECANCHRIEDQYALFTDGEFHSAGVGLDRIRDRLPELAKVAYAIDREDISVALRDVPDLSELGRYLVTKDPRDIGKFRTPTLRNVAHTAPYMHDGSIATLDAAVDQELYYRSLEKGRIIALTREERDSLLKFLEALSGEESNQP